MCTAQADLSAALLPGEIFVLPGRSALTNIQHVTLVCQAWKGRIERSGQRRCL